jgi:signal transduction histidine kinase
VGLKIEDTGIGISQEKMTKIFDRFYQIDSSSTRKVGGAGIGLSVVKEYVELHQGKIHVESEPGKGSTFTVFLPDRPATVAKGAKEK